MKKLLLLSSIVLFGLFIWQGNVFLQSHMTGAPPYDPAGGNVSQNADFSYLQSWKRPEGPVKVALQVGHWKNDELPDELEKLRGNTGSSGGGKSEAEVNLKIAEETQKILEKNGITVELLPTAIPPGYFADVFIAIHADGHTDPTRTGFKAAAPRRDMTGKAEKLVEYIKNEYAKETELSWDEETITRNMTGYYAFSWWRYVHAVHPMTVSAIIETGYLTSWSDQQLLIYSPEIPAKGIANAVLMYLSSEKLLPSPSPQN